MQRGLGQGSPNAALLLLPPDHGQSLTHFFFFFFAGADDGRGDGRRRGRGSGGYCWRGRGSLRRAEAVRFPSSLPAAALPVQAERMLGDNFRPPAPSPSAIAQSRLVSMGTCTRLPLVRESREGDACVSFFACVCARLKGV